MARSSFTFFAPLISYRSEGYFSNFYLIIVLCCSAVIFSARWTTKAGIFPVLISLDLILVLLQPIVVTIIRFSSVSHCRFSEAVSGVRCEQYHASKTAVDSHFRISVSPFTVPWCNTAFFNAVPTTIAFLIRFLVALLSWHRFLSLSLRGKLSVYCLRLFQCLSTALVGWWCFLYWLR